eukprot:gb/GECH01013310.1/.p1 GENE.gb/GECH01013310.1/~~gb/GECH01013310.1/.p1  ORF type:complete len:199 (+),score=54.99 gb/GECH01013310.1/:1-597(+)
MSLYSPDYFFEDLFDLGFPGLKYPRGAAFFRSRRPRPYPTRHHRSMAKKGQKPVKSSSSEKNQDKASSALGTRATSLPPELMWSPAVDVVERSDHSLHITAELPGLSRKDVNVHYDKDTHSLTISGEMNRERKEPQEEEGEGMMLKERFHGHFERRFKLPQNVDGSKIEGSMDAGILSLTVPHKVTPEKKKPFEIQIQ